MRGADVLTWGSCGAVCSCSRSSSPVDVVRIPKMVVIVSEHEQRGRETYLGRLHRVGEGAGGGGDETAGGRRREVVDGGGGEQRGRVALFEPTPPDLARRGPRPRGRQY